MARLIAVTGGIGSGKSVVCRILTASGFQVYNCDERARHIMDTDPQIWAGLCSQIHPQAVKDGIVDRTLISSIVFSDPDKLEKLNSIVHGAVQTDVLNWYGRRAKERMLFVETAILYQSGLNRFIDEDWQVTAPEDVRIARVMARNNLSREAVVARICAQKYEIPPSARRVSVRTIINDNITPLLPQIEKLLEEE